MEKKYKDCADGVVDSFSKKCSRLCGGDLDVLESDNWIMDCTKYKE